METERDLEGPFLTLADFIRAQEIRERLRRKKRSDALKTAGHNEQTFELTTTHHEEDERPISRASDEISFTSKSVASLATTQYAVKKQANRSIQTVPLSGQQDPELFLRRYYFKIDWSKRTPSLETACKCKDLFQNFREGLNEVASRRRAAAAALAESKKLAEAAVKSSESSQDWAEKLKRKKQAPSPKISDKNIQTEGQGSIFPPTKAKKAVMDSKDSDNKKEAPYNEVPPGSLSYYEVKLNKNEVHPEYDYTVDYRRYSYADFKVDDCIENSTILPEMLAAWLTSAEPRNQDDVHPLFVLCKDLLKKFCLRETQYSFKREEYLGKQINNLQKELDETVAQRNDDQEKFRVASESFSTEIKDLQEKLSSTQADLSAARAEIESLELGKKLLLQLISELQPQCESQVRQLQEQLASIRNLEQVVSVMDNAFRDIKHEAQVTKSGAYAQTEKLQAEVVRLTMLNRLANDRIALLEDALKTSNNLNDEIMGHFNALMSRKPEEVLESMPIEQKVQFLKILIGDPDNLLMHVEESDLTALSVHCLRFAACLFLGGIRIKSSNHGAWLDAISESLGCTPDMLVSSVLVAMKADGRPATLASCESTSVIWSFVAKELSIADAEIDYDSFEKLNTGGRILRLKFVSQDESEDDRDSESLSSLRDDLKSEPSFLETDERVTPQSVQGMGGGAVQYVYKTVEIRREEEYIVKKYGLFNMKVIKGVESYTIEETMVTIGAILDFKAESDYHCDMSIRPRLNMVKVIRLFMTQKYKHYEDTETELKRICKSVLSFRNQNGLVKVFGTISGMTDTTHWSERSACFLIELLKAVKLLDEPGEESKDPDTLAEGWNIYRTWISNPDRAVAKAHFLQGLAQACESMYGFGPMPAEQLEQALHRCTVPTPKTKKPPTQRVKLHAAINSAISMWFTQLDNSRRDLKELFLRNDVNGDGVLEMHEFIHLIKSTGYRMRQHDAMNMFHELAGPDDTVDQDEFSELVVFIKFNVRAILGQLNEV